MKKVKFTSTLTSQEIKIQLLYLQQLVRALETEGDNTLYQLAEEY